MLCYPWVSCKAGACCLLFSYWGCGQVFHKIIHICIYIQIILCACRFSASASKWQVWFFYKQESQVKWSNHHHCNNYFSYTIVIESDTIHYNLITILGEGVHQASQSLEELPGMGRQWKTKVIPIVNSGAEVLWDCLQKVGIWPFYQGDSQTVSSYMWLCVYSIMFFT